MPSLKNTGCKSAEREAFSVIISEVYILQEVNNH